MSRDGTATAPPDKPSDVTPFRRVLSERVRTYLRAGLRINFPPPGFDPRKASDRELAQYFLPPRPDAGSAPRARALWEEAMSGPPVWPRLPAPEAAPALAAAPAVEDVLLERLFVETWLRPHPRVTRTAGASYGETSSNWSGAYARPRDFSAMRRVQGLWTVPTPQPLTPGAATYASSIWVGLDGHDPASRSLPQIGTGQWVSVDAGGTVQPSIFTWWQWFVRGSPDNRGIAIRDVTAAPGNLIFAQVEALGPALASFFIVNLSTKAAFPMWFERWSDDMAPLDPPLSATNPLHPRIEGRTADWILERPAELGTGRLLPLPDYRSATFHACCAGTDSTGPLPNREIVLSRARLIRMVDWEASPPSGEAVSSPDREGPLSVRLHYG